jgi:hypothetical protein
LVPSRPRTNHSITQNMLDQPKRHAWSNV